MQPVSPGLAVVAAIVVDAGACASLAALETANTLNRVGAYRGMAWVFGWCIAEGRSQALAGMFFAVGSSLVALGAVVFELVVTPQLQKSSSGEE